MLFHFGRGNSVEPGDGFVDHPRRCLRHRRRHESGRYSRHSPSLGAGSTPLVSRRLVQPARCLRLHARLRHVPGRCAIDDRRAAVAWPTMLVPPSTTAGDNFPGVTANVSVAAAPAVMAVTVTTMVIVTTSQLPGCRVGYARDNFRRPPSRLRSNCRRRRTLYFFRSPSTPGTNSERSPGHWPGHSRARASHGARRDTPGSRQTPPHFGRRKRRLRRRLRRPPRPPRLTTLAPEPPTIPPTRASAKVLAPPTMARTILRSRPCALAAKPAPFNRRGGSEPPSSPASILPSLFMKFLFFSTPSGV